MRVPTPTSSSLPSDAHAARLMALQYHLLEAARELDGLPVTWSGHHGLDALTCRRMARAARDDLDAMLDEEAAEHPEPGEKTRDHSVPCRICRRPTFNHAAVCDDCLETHGPDGERRLERVTPARCTDCGGWHLEPGPRCVPCAKAAHPVRKAVA